MPGGASLYSLSVAWVSSLGRSRLKGVRASLLGFVMCVAKLNNREHLCSKVIYWNQNGNIFHSLWPWIRYNCDRYNRVWLYIQVTKIPTLRPMNYWFLGNIKNIFQLILFFKNLTCNQLPIFKLRKLNTAA